MSVTCTPVGPVVDVAPMWCARLVRHEIESALTSERPALDLWRVAHDLDGIYPERFDSKEEAVKFIEARQPRSLRALAV